MRKTEFIKNMECRKKSILGEGFFRCAFDNTIINLGTAENRLINDLLLPLLQNRPEFSAFHTTYNAGTIQKPLKSAVAALFRDHFGIKDAQDDQIVFGSGIAMLIERLGLVLVEPGEIVLIPKPCYGAFEPDLIMCKAQVVYIDLDDLPPAPPENAKLLILTNPGNPEGNIIPNQNELLQWAYQNPDLHIVTDDVYALTNRKNQSFQSIAGLESAKPDRVHLFYGISKDWGLAGFHVGFFWSRCKEIVSQVSLACGCFCLGSDTQQILTRIFGDFELRDRIISISQERLIHAENTAKSQLSKYNIPFISYDNSLFLLIDLTDLATNAEEEVALFRKLLNEYKIHVLPAHVGFQYKHTGWFRLCFSCEDNELIEGLSRLGNAVIELRSNKH